MMDRLRTPGNPDGLETPIAIIGAVILAALCASAAWVIR